MRDDDAGRRRHALRWLHAQGRAGAQRCSGRRLGAGEPVGQAGRHGASGDRCRQPRPGRGARPDRLQGRRACRWWRGIGAGARSGLAEARRRCRLCGRQHHAAVGVGVVRGRRRHEPVGAGDLPLAVGADRAAGGRLCGPAVLRLGGAGPACPTPEHGRADLARRHAGDGHEPVPDHARQRAGLLRCRRHAAVLPAGRTLPRPAHAHARGRCRRQSARPARVGRYRAATGRQHGETRRAPAGARHARADRARRALRRRRPTAAGQRRGRRQPDHRRDRAGRRAARRADLCRYRQPVRIAHHAGHRHRPAHAARRDRAPDGGCRAGARALRAASPTRRRASMHRPCTCSGSSHSSAGSRPGTAGKRP